MLKALELAGFKSFADRTRFEFPRGISVVVGPNGSGKSNLVDAVKWVLGSQSAKSLRGKEMTDVIFNGCASRGPLGTGEATLTLDNEDGRLPIDAKEVLVTRRVYRSGEGEYLLNRQPCRLRDVREVLAGTGITTEAYCIIEQGKVDALLQSSPRDRRVIFEEAAGISQFKAKKAAALRRMERVEQNLLRLSDIVDEVESRLRSIRAQAGKARRYREYTQRLQFLRTEVGLLDWRSLTNEITARDSQLSELRSRSDERGKWLEQSEAELQALERQIEDGIQQQRELEAVASATREEIAARLAAADSQRARRDDLQLEIARIGEQLQSMMAREDSKDDPFHDSESRLRAAKEELAEADAARQEHERRAEKSQHEFDRHRQSLDQIRLELAESSRLVKSLEKRLSELESQRASGRESLDQQQRRLAVLEQQREIHTAELTRLEQAEAVCAEQVQLHEASLQAAEERVVQIRRELARADKQHRQLDAGLTRTLERIAVLSELEQRQEGIAGGVQEVLQQAQQEPDGAFGEVRGVVADLFHVDVDSAPLVEMALGERAQFVVMESVYRLLELLEGGPLGAAGRIGFLSLEQRESLTALDHVDLSAESGVMGRADRFVEAATNVAPLARRLLGRTWLVDRLSTALRLSQTTGRGLDFVTSDGELLAADGTLVVGPRQAAASILSRRSELRACHEQVRELEQQLAHHAAICARLESERTAAETNSASLVATYTASAGKLGECGQATAAARGRLERVSDEVHRIEQELCRSEEQVSTLEVDLQATRREQIEAKHATAQLANQLQSGDTALDVLRQRQSELQAAATQRQIAAAKCEQRVEMLMHQVEQAARSQQERERVLADTCQRLAERNSLVAELEATILAGGQVLAVLSLRKEEEGREMARQAAAIEATRLERTTIADRIRDERQQFAAIQSQLHKLEVAVTRLRHERHTLFERMQEDYGIDLEIAANSRVQEAENRAIEVESTDFLPAPGRAPSGWLGAFDREAAEREIAELRSQINHIGAINLEALDELEQLEARFEMLSSQYRDLVDAKASLERIIQRINVDSRQLFLDTLETVCEHFQELFRRLFGGGEADIVVDDAQDVLECGIEIVARPPGKEACSISLLSGGEKTLTCVALLLAVFRSKPSPFCVLDEVDAALDEANIGRFIGVLREFLSFTQFVVVTHSKKTMSGADTLYGVTMEESGVSKRVSVRFEDVSEDGQIRASALRHAA